MFGSPRFILTREQCGAALALAGVRPTERSTLTGLPHSGDPVRLLRDTPLLLDGETLSEEAVFALRAAADPVRILSCATNLAGEKVWQEVLLMHGDQTEGPFTALESYDDSFAFTSLPHADAVNLLVQDLLGFPQGSSEPEASPLTFPLAAYAALLAAADALQATRLRNRLARTDPAQPVISAPLLEAHLMDGLSHPDTHWAVAVGARLSPPQFSGTGGKMAAGVRALEGAGILQPVARGYSFTTSGLAIAGSLCTLVKSAGLSLAAPRGAERLTLGHVTFFCGIRDVWMAEWLDLSSPQATIRLVRAGSAGDCAVLRDFVKAVPPVPEEPVLPSLFPAQKVAATERTCPVCREPVGESARFCSGCGFEFAAKKPPHCPHCGKEVKAGSQFCTSCGGPLHTGRVAPLGPAAPAPEPEKPAPVVERRCPDPRCGIILPEDKNFCTACGIRVGRKEQG